MEPQVLRLGILDIQVCVPDDWTDDQIVEYATEQSPGCDDGWKIRDEPELLAGCPARNPCSDRPDCVHVTLDTLRIGAAHQKSRP